MAYTQSDLDAIERAIASGALRVQYPGGAVEYRSLDELLKAKREILAAMNNASGTGKPRIVRLFSRT